MLALTGRQAPGEIADINRAKSFSRPLLSTVNGDRFVRTSSNVKCYNWGRASSDPMFREIIHPVNRIQFVPMPNDTKMTRRERTRGHSIRTQCRVARFCRSISFGEAFPEGHLFPADYRPFAIPRVQLTIKQPPRRRNCLFAFPCESTKAHYVRSIECKRGKTFSDVPESACVSKGVLLFGVSCPLVRSTET